MTKIILSYEGALSEDTDKRDWTHQFAVEAGTASVVTAEIQQRPGVTMSVYAADGARLTGAAWWPRYAGDPPGVTETAEAFVLRQLSEAAERTHQRRRSV